MGLKLCLKFPLFTEVERGIIEKGNDMSKTTKQQQKRVGNKPNMGSKYTDFVMEGILIEIKVPPFSSTVQWE